jgi:predicted SAM-dependent methyltransferase
LAARATVAPVFRSTRPPVRLHIGAGAKPLAGWINVDRKRVPGVDVVADVTKGLRFERVEAIFAEHFLEHLALSDAVAFLLEAHRVLAPERCLRLSTPNLDWVWRTHYPLEAPEAERRLAALRVNRAFHGWGHQFLWNREMLASALQACGFVDLVWCRYGESSRELFRGLEQHEPYGDAPDLPHVIIVEATRGEPRPAELATLRELIERELTAHLTG